ncbi:MAG TPA: trehalose-6-phosphate synthase [Thermoanaerobaculia bacterium]|nr:trehalose-6-phosphate synthase [Thermoanaerobaculia bacterium]
MRAPALSDLRLPGPPRAARTAGRCIVVSERLPIVFTRDGGQGRWRVVPAGGALISALTPVLRERRGVWIGWPGVTAEEVPGLRRVLAGAIQEGGGFSLRPVLLNAQEKRLAYDGFARQIVWPLFHDLPLECSCRPAHWQAYLKVNRKFARAAAKTLARGAGGADLVWAQDPLLMQVAAELRRLGAGCRTAFFLHLPFPAPDLFLKLPWRERLLNGLLAFDQIGFQTERDLEHFLACVRALAHPSIESPAGKALWTLVGRGNGGAFDLRAGAFPIGVDARQIEERAAGPEVAARTAALGTAMRGRKLVIGVDRIDTATGIPEKLRAFAGALTRYPELQERVTLVQVAIPGRESLPRLAALRSDIERLVGEINGLFGKPGWVPVHYLHRELEPEELLAYYRLADVALVTPLKAGMHLAAKEYCAANLEARGALVLSEFAGAAAQLAAGALLVNPFDTQGVARTLRRALRMPERERLARMRSLRREVRLHDVSWWAGSFLASALAERTSQASIS